MRVKLLNSQLRKAQPVTLRTLDREECQQIAGGAVRGGSYRLTILDEPTSSVKSDDLLLVANVWNG